MRGRFFNWRAIGEAALYMVLAIVIVGAAISLAAGYTRTHPPGVAAVSPADARTFDLPRCQPLGLAAEHDAACRAAWDESRRRFLTYTSSRIAPPRASVSSPSFEDE